MHLWHSWTPSKTLPGAYDAPRKSQRTNPADSTECAHYAPGWHKRKPTHPHTLTYIIRLQSKCCGVLFYIYIKKKEARNAERKDPKTKIMRSDDPTTEKLGFFLSSNSHHSKVHARISPQIPFDSLPNPRIIVADSVSPRFPLPGELVIVRWLALFSSFSAQDSEFWVWFMLGVESRKIDALV